MTPRRTALVATLAFTTWLCCAATSLAQLDRSAESAVFVIRQGMQPSSRGTHNLVLRALRHLEDPNLRPLFTHLADRGKGAVKIHGILGLAELSDPQVIDLKRIAPLEPAAVQAEAISAAQDAELLTLEQCRQMTRWSGLDPGITLILAARMIQNDHFDQQAVLRETLNAPRLSRRCLAAAMLVQLGEDDAMDVLRELAPSNDRMAESVLEMVLQSAVRWQMDRLGPWAMTLTRDPTLSLKQRVNALTVAMRFDTPGSLEQWQTLFDSSSDLAQKNRLALAALKLAPWIQDAPFVHLRRQNDPLLKAIGSAGAAVVHQENVAPAVVTLVEQNHPLCNDWALSYGADKAEGDDRDLILLSLILAYEAGPDRGRAQRLDMAASAVQGLVERSPERAPDFLRPMLHSTDTPEKLRTGMLLGLIRARNDAAHRVIRGWQNTGLPLIDGLALLLRAKYETQLGDDELNELGLIARGGGGLDLGLRAQAAWAYLSQTGQAAAALDAALSSR